MIFIVYLVFQLYIYFLFSDNKYSRDFSNSVQSITNAINGSLTLNPVIKEHEGTYLCKADNDVGEPLEKEANLIVHGKI